MSDIYETRKSIRKYKDKEVPEELIREVLEAGRVAPSAKNRQPWRFIVYRGESKAELLNCLEKGIEKQKKNPFIPGPYKKGLASAENTLRIMREAPVTVIVLNERSGNPYMPVLAGKRISEIHNTLSIGAAVENMLLKACELGLGGLWIGNTVYSHAQLIKFIGTKKQIACAVSLGYPDEEPEGRPRMELEEIVEFR